MGGRGRGRACRDVDALARTKEVSPLVGVFACGDRNRNEKRPRWKLSKSTSFRTPTPHANCT